MVLVQGVKWVILVKQSTIANTKSNPLTRGKSVMKSREIDAQGRLGMGSCWSRSYGWCYDTLNWTQISYVKETNWTIFMIAKWLVNGSPWLFCNIRVRYSPLGTYKIFSQYTWIHSQLWINQFLFGWVIKAYLNLNFHWWNCWFRRKMGLILQITRTRGPCLFELHKVEREREDVMSMIELFEVALLWHARMCRMSSKKAEFVAIRIKTTCWGLLV